MPPPQGARIRRILSPPFVPVFGENPRPPVCHSEATAEESRFVHSILRCLRFFTSFRMTLYNKCEVDKKTADAVCIDG